MERSLVSGVANGWRPGSLTPRQPFLKSIGLTDRSPEQNNLLLDTIDTGIEPGGAEYARGNRVDHSYRHCCRRRVRCAERSFPESAAGAVKTRSSIRRFVLLS